MKTCAHIDLIFGNLLVFFGILMLGNPTILDLAHSHSGKPCAGPGKIPLVVVWILCMIVQAIVIKIHEANCKECNEWFPRKEEEKTVETGGYKR